MQIIDEFTGRVMADRSWRHGLHQAIEVKEGVTGHRRQGKPGAPQLPAVLPPVPDHGRHDRHGVGIAPASCGRSTSARSSASRPTSRASASSCPLRMFDTMDEKWDAVVKRVLRAERQGRADADRHAHRCWRREEVSKRLTAAGRVAPRAQRDADRAGSRRSSPRPASTGKITVATNMAGRGTDIKLARGVADLGGLHVISTEPHGSGRVDRQLFGRAARQGDPGCAQMFASAEDDLFIRHAERIRASLARASAPTA